MKQTENLCDPIDQKKMKCCRKWNYFYILLGLLLITKVKIVPYSLTSLLDFCGYVVQQTQEEER